MGSKIEVVMQIDDLQVISFDKFNFKQSQSVEYDEQVRIHVNFVIHFLAKKSLLEETKTMVPLTKQVATSKSFLDQQLSSINRA